MNALDYLSADSGKKAESREENPPGANNGQGAGHVPGNYHVPVSGFEHLKLGDLIKKLEEDLDND